MRKAEQRLYDTMARRLFWMKMWRIENLLGAGFPDVVLVNDGRANFIELKAPKFPAREKTPVLAAGRGLRPEQRGCLFEMYKAGAQAWILVRDEGGISSSPLLISALFAPHLHELCASDLHSVAKAIGWSEIAEAL